MLKVSGVLKNRMENIKMSVEKYETLKHAVNEMTKIYGDEKGIQAVSEILNAIEKVDIEETKEQTALIERSTWDSMGYLDRIELKQSNAEQFDAAMAGNFKGGN